MNVTFYEGKGTPSSKGPGSIYFSKDTGRIFYSPESAEVIEMGTNPSNLYVLDDGNIQCNDIRVPDGTIQVGYLDYNNSGYYQSLITPGSVTFNTSDDSNSIELNVQSSPKFKLYTKSSFIEQGFENTYQPYIKLYNTVGATFGVLKFGDGQCNASQTITMSANSPQSIKFYIPGLVFAIGSVRFVSCSNGWNKSYFSLASPSISGFGLYDGKLCTTISVNVSVTSAVSAATLTVMFYCSSIGRE